MKNEVWDKIAEFLKELRCENTERSSYINLPEYKSAVKEKGKQIERFEQILPELSKTQREIIDSYVTSAEKCAEEENQQAYMQGMVDILFLLAAIGWIPEAERLKDLIENLW